MEAHELDSPYGVRDPAPGDLELLRAFTNTNDLDAGSDDFGTPEGLRAWLVERSLLDPGTGVEDADLRRAIAIREGLREMATANGDGGTADPATLARMREASRELALTPLLDVGSWGLGPSSNGVDGALERLLAIATTAMADGSWSRMKACRNDRCRWLFYDHSRNRSSAWCSMAVCGARAKARAYRHRRATPTPA